MSQRLAGWKRSWRWLVVLLAAGAMFVAALAVFDWLLPAILPWVKTWATTPLAKRALARFEDSGAWGLAGLLSTAVVTLGGRWAGRAADDHRAVPPALEIPGWVVDRPFEVGLVVRQLLRRRGSGTVGITTSLYGAGGFGKTTLARVVCADQRVRQHVGGRIFFVTVGRDVRGNAAIAAKVNDVIKLVCGEDATFTDARLAGQRLGSLLDDRPRRLLVLDDVWSAEQLAPFLLGGRQCARLVTTRIPEVMAGRGALVLVDQMSLPQARKVLTYDLPTVASAVVDGLLMVTGRWALLLRLANKILVDGVRTGADVSVTGQQLWSRLEAAGPAAVDLLTGMAGGGADRDDPGRRAQAVRPTIEASTSLLAAGEPDRFAELAVFAEDEMIPVGLIARLWKGTAGLDELQSRQLCARLADLALISVSAAGGGLASVHDVVRDFLHHELGSRRLVELHRVLLDAVAEDLPRVGPLPPGAPGHPRPAWWQLGDNRRYLWDHLIEHLIGADQIEDAEAVAGDLRWAGARLLRFGPAAPHADLTLIDTQRAARMRRAWSRTAHLLGPTDPTEAVIDVLHSRLGEDPDWGPQAVALRGSYDRPRMVNRWRLPDLPDPALLRSLSGHAGSVGAVAIAGDSSWLAAGFYDGTLQIWDAVTWQLRVTFTGLTGQIGSVGAVAIAADGSWVATSSGFDEKVRIWDAATGRLRRTLTGHTDRVSVIAIALDGSWLAAGSSTDGMVRMWDVATGRHRVTLTGHSGSVSAVAIAPDGTWLATGDEKGTTRIWDVATGRYRVTLTGHSGSVSAVAIAPDGSWLATTGAGETRIWDVATGRHRVTLTGSVSSVAIAPDGSWLATTGAGEMRIWDAATWRHTRVSRTGHTGRVHRVAIAPDGSWLATGGHGDATVQIWDTEAGQHRVAVTGNTFSVSAVATAPDGTWLATGSYYDGTVHVWDAATGEARVTITTDNTFSVRAVAIAPDGSWLATGGYGTVQIWDATSGQTRVTLTGHTGSVSSVAIAPDGSWLATGCSDGTVRIWDATSGQTRVTLTGHTGSVSSVAIAPDGSWLATGSDNDETVRIWDTDTGQTRVALTVTRRNSWVSVVAIVPDGSWLATAGGEDRSVRIWDSATGQLRVNLTGHTDSVSAVAIASDGRWLASADGEGGTVRIWDTSTWRVVAMMRLNSTVRVCAWLPLCDAIAVGGPAGLYLFDFLATTKGAT